MVHNKFVIFHINYVKKNYLQMISALNL